MVRIRKIGEAWKVIDVHHSFSYCVCLLLLLVSFFIATYDCSVCQFQMMLM